IVSSVNFTTVRRAVIPGGGVDLYFRVWLFVRLYEILGGFFLGSRSVIVSPHCLPVFVHRAIALARNVEEFPKIDARPDLYPTGLQIAINRRAELIRRRLIVALLKEQFANAIMRQRAGFVHIQRCLVCLQRIREVTDLDKLLSAADRD